MVLEDFFIQRIFPVLQRFFSAQRLFSDSELATFRKLNSHLQRPSNCCEGLPDSYCIWFIRPRMSVAIGAAQAKKLNNYNHLVYALQRWRSARRPKLGSRIMYASTK
jgi:transketolase